MCHCGDLSPYPESRGELWKSTEEACVCDMIRSEVIKDHSDYSVENRLKMRRIVYEESGSEPPSVGLGERLVLLTRVKVRDMQRTGPT